MADTAKNMTQSKKQIPTISAKEKNQAKLKYQRDKDRQKVKGVFRFYEVPGGSMSFVYKNYKEDPVERFDLVDGEIYTIPLGVAKHLNKNGWYPIHSHALDESGNPSIKVGKKKRRFSFQSLDFMDIEELSIPDKEIITIEHV